MQAKTQQKQNKHTYMKAENDNIFTFVVLKKLITSMRL